VYNGRYNRENNTVAKYRVEMILDDGGSGASLQELKEDIVFCMETLFDDFNAEDIKVERVKENETSKAG
jgi:hypothetical protein